MPDEARPLGTRLAAAFWLQYNVIALLGCLCFSLALASWAPVVLGLVGEGLWLTAATAVGELAGWVAARSLSDEEREEHEALAPDLRNRAQRVRETTEAIKRQARRAHELGPSDVAFMLEQAGEVQRAFVRLAHAHQRLSAALSGVDAADLHDDVQRVNDAVARERDLVVKLGLKQALGAAQRKVRERERSVEALHATEVQMRTIESALTSVRSALTSDVSPRDCSAQIEALAIQLAACAALEGETSSVLATPGRGGRSTSPSLHSEH